MQDCRKEFIPKSIIRWWRHRSPLSTYQPNTTTPFRSNVRIRCGPFCPQMIAQMIKARRGCQPVRVTIGNHVHFSPPVALSTLPSVAGLRQVLILVHCYSQWTISLSQSDRTMCQQLFQRINESVELIGNPRICFPWERRCDLKSMIGTTGSFSLCFHSRASQWL